MQRGTLRQILDVLKQTYCQNIGVEYRHIQDSGEKAWLQDRLEPAEGRAPLEAKIRRQTLQRLIAAETWNAISTQGLWGTNDSGWKVLKPRFQFLPKFSPRPPTPACRKRS